MWVLVSLGEQYAFEVKRHEGEVLGEVRGEYPGEYVTMANRAQSPCRRTFCDSWVSMVSIFLNSLFLDGTILEKYSTSFEKYSWSIFQNSWRFLRIHYKAGIHSLRRVAECTESDTDTLYNKKALTHF